MSKNRVIFLNGIRSILKSDTKSKCQFFKVVNVYRYFFLLYAKSIMYGIINCTYNLNPYDCFSKALYSLDIYVIYAVCS